MANQTKNTNGVAARFWSDSPSHRKPFLRTGYYCLLPGLDPKAVMMTGSLPGERDAYVRPPPTPPTGIRCRARRSANIHSLAVAQAAQNFTGLPDGVTHPARLIDTLRAAAPALGVPKAVVELLANVCSRTQVRDWQASSRPLAWPSNLELGHALGRKPTAVNDAIRYAVHHGFVIMKDSQTGKRYGTRVDGAIVEDLTFGFDLSPLALRYAELQAAASAHRTRHINRMKARRMVTCERERLLQLVDTAESQGLWSSFWADMALRANNTRHLLTPSLPLTETQQLAETLATWRAEAAHALEQALPISTLVDHHPVAHPTQPILVSATPAVLAPAKPASATKTESAHSENRKLKNTTINDSNKRDVQAWRKSGAGSSAPLSPAQTRTNEIWRDHAPWDPGRLNLPQLRLSAPELAALVPELGQRLCGAEPTWGSVSAVLRAYARDIGLSVETLRQAEADLGWQSMFIGLAIVASKQAQHFDVSPAAYFLGGILKRARSGTLDLKASLWGLRAPAKPLPPPARVAQTAHGEPKPIAALLPALEMPAHLKRRLTAEAPPSVDPPDKPVQSDVRSLIEAGRAELRSYGVGTPAFWAARDRLKQEILARHGLMEVPHWLR